MHPEPGSTAPTPEARQATGAAGGDGFESGVRVRRRRSLRTRFVVTIATLVAAVLAANALVLGLSSRASLRHDVETRARAFATLAVGPLCEAYTSYYTSGYGKFRELASDLQRLNADLVRMSIHDTAGGVLFDSRELADPLFEPGSRRVEAAPDPEVRAAAVSMETVTWRTQEDGAERLMILVPYIEQWGRHRYSALFVLSYESLEAALRSALGRIGWLSVLSLALGVVIAIVLSGQSLTPILALTEGARDLARGRLDRRIELRTGDEFQVLSDAFDTMASRLDTTITDLESSNVALETMNRELKELDRMKSDLLANVSHELRTPLTAIQGYTEAVEEGMLGPVAQAQREAFAVVRRNIQRLRAMIEQLLSYSRLEAGRVRIEPQAFDLAALAAQVLAALRPAVPDGVELASRVAPALPPVWGDPARIAQVLENLLTNAVKFTPPGGRVELTLTPVEGGGAAGGEAVDGREVEIAVRDTGIGIPVAEQQRIFERFYQVDGSSTRRYGGMGLGLAIVQEIVAAHGSRIDLESTPGEGSTFRFHLPAARSGHPRPNGPRILLVDDDPVFAGSVAAGLERHGYQVATAATLEAASEAIDTTPPDLVVLDRLLPDGDGFDLLERLRGDGAPDAGGGRKPRVPVVVVSVRKERALGLRLGAAGYLVKPIDAEALRGAIENVLGAASPAADTRRQILVVDDEDDLRELLVERLAVQGFRAIGAAGGHEALARLSAERPDLVLLDLMMPDLDGWEVLRRIRADARLRDLPVVILTARDTPQDRRIGAELAILDFFDKPFDMGRLVAEIERSLLAGRTAGDPP